MILCDQVKTVSSRGKGGDTVDGKSTGDVLSSIVATAQGYYNSDNAFNFYRQVKEEDNGERVTHASVQKTIFVLL